MDDVVIRASRPEDMAAVADLRWRWSVEEDGRVPTVTPEAYRDATAAFGREHADSHRCVVAERGGVVLGMAWLALNPRPPVPHRPHGRVAAELQSVYVHPDLRGGGVAGALVAALVDLADEAGAERVVVHSSVVGERLYRRLGFGDARLLLQRPPED
ncbi:MULTISPECIES: GNAT family N-acetyltransferase [unclassified Curtobacterium]|uniref:GNAT family N-acetyltransferase n=1 Tax=unclassified Curtobacterium TaxID=257496 RepID=UPI000826D077|nr:MULTISPECIES: GNAT family N-acetyltransferase [unclassified Curtobacterium]WIA95322.1 GNAT family N-acetyltransferase [Curtobacterium sp. MCBA15_004]